MKKPVNKRKIVRNILIGVAAIIVVCIVGVAIILNIHLSKGKKSLFNSDNIVTEGSLLNGKNIDDIYTKDEENFKYNSDMVNILLLGVDNENGLSEKQIIGELGQTDAIFLLSIDTKSKKSKIISIPRDTLSMVEIYDKYDNLTDIIEFQITVQYAFANECRKGAKLTADRVSEIMGNIPIHRVCVINYDAVSVANDAIGGVQVTFDDEFTDESGQEMDAEFHKGNTVTLKGDQARIYVMERDCSLENGVLDRGARQINYISLYIDKLKSKMKSNIMLPFNILDELKEADCFYTDISKDELLYIASCLKNMKLDEDSIVTIPGGLYSGEVFQQYEVDVTELRKLVLDTYYVKVN